MNAPVNYFIENHLPPLIKEIKKLIAHKKNIYHSLPTNKIFIDFINNLNELAPPPNNWEKNEPFLKQIEIINQQIIQQLTEEETKMNPAMATTPIIATKTLLIMGGAITLLGIALYAYRSQQNKDSKIKNNSAIKPKEIAKEAQAAGTNEQQDQASTYKQQVLLLVIDAKQLDADLKQDSHISKDAAERVIANASFAYCYAEGDSEGQSVLNAIDPSDEKINYESEERVFLQLSLSAKPEITAGKHDKLGIREAMQLDKEVEIKRLQKLQTMRSVKAFHSI